MIHSENLKLFSKLPLQVLIHARHICLQDISNYLAKDRPLTQRKIRLHKAEALSDLALEIQEYLDNYYIPAYLSIDSQKEHDAYMLLEQAFVAMPFALSLD